MDICRLGMVVLMALGAGGCGDTEEAAPPTPADDKCPNVGMDAMDGRWIKVEGSKGDQKYRFQLDKAGDIFTMSYIGGGFTRKALNGVRRTSDHQFTEIPDARKKAAYEAGSEGLLRIYVEPRKNKCALRISEVEVSLKDGKETERPKAGFAEYIAFPEGFVFGFAGCDGPVFLGPAAKDRSVAEKQLAEIGGPDPGHALGEAIPVATWAELSEADAACTWTMDLWFDDQPYKDQKGVAVPVKAGWQRFGIDDWYAPFSGNHHFQIYRHKSCGGGPPELVGVACLESVLQ